MGRGIQEPRRDREGPRQGKEARRLEAGEKVSKTFWRGARDRGTQSQQRAREEGPKAERNRDQSRGNGATTRQEGKKAVKPGKGRLGSEQGGVGEGRKWGWGWEEAGLRQVGTAQRNQREVMATRPHLPTQAWLKASC